MATELFNENLATTTVTSGGTDAPVSGTTETWTVASSAMFGAASTGVSQFHVADPNAPTEMIAVTNVSGTTWTVTRGAEITTPVSHTGGFTVCQVTTAGWLAAVTATAYGALPLAGGTLTGPVSNTSLNTWDLDSFAGTDDQKMASALAAWSAAGSGKIILGARAHTFANQWSTSYSAGVAQGLIIEGAGVAYNGAWGTPSAATTCTFTYSGAGAACTDFQHIGTIELRGIQFKSANAAVPLFQTTNATPSIHDCVFSGGGTGTSCATDAIVLGGTSTTVGSGDTAKYNAYQGTVYRNFFDGVRRIVLFNVAANSVHVYDNTVSTSCGTNLPFGAAFDLIGTSSKSINDVQIVNNCVEISNYFFGIKATWAQQCTFGPNGFYDPAGNYTAAVCLLASAVYNRIRSGFHSDSYPFVIDYPGGSSVENVHQSQHSVIREPLLIAPLVTGGTGYLGPEAATFRGYDQYGDYAALAPLLESPGSGGYATVGIVSGNCTSVSDGATYNGSNWVTSVSSAAFTNSDEWLPIAATGIPTPSYIQNVAGPATAWPWQASYAYSLGDIARPASANSHLYQCTTAGTSGASQPAWPTGGGTVTDGTAVWTDLGTSATAVFISQAATATGSSLITRWGRLAQAQRTLVQFARFHMVTQGSAPACTADAGAGTSPSGISVSGTDMKFTVAITTGSSPASGDCFHVAPAQAWVSSTPVFMMAAGNSAAASLMAGGYWLTVSSGTVTVNFVNAPSASTAYSFSFLAIG